MVIKVVFYFPDIKVQTNKKLWAMVIAPENSYADKALKIFEWPEVSLENSIRTKPFLNIESSFIS